MTIDDMMKRCVPTDGPMLTRCMVWAGGKTGKGYSQVRVKGVLTLVHRLAWMKSRGPIPNGLCVCHRCDVRSCCNPDHLFVGTHKDNFRDMCDKGRRFTPRGAAINMAKLTKEKVLEIRRRYATGEVYQRALAAEYGVRENTLFRIIHRQTWTHI